MGQKKLDSSESRERSFRYRSELLFRSAPTREDGHAPEGQPQVPNLEDERHAVQRGEQQGRQDLRKGWAGE